jgi:hypothetical protein
MRIAQRFNDVETLGYSRLCLRDSKFGSAIFLCYVP